MKLTRTRLYAFLGVWWAAFVALSATRFGSFQVLNIVGFGALLTCFGLPVYLSLRLKKRPLWQAVTSVVALSLLIIMLTLLGGNTVLPHIGISRPLDHAPVLATLSAGLLITLAACWFQLEGLRLRIKSPLIWFKSRLELIVTAISPLFVIGSMAGAISLNNNGPGTVALINLTLIGVYLGVLLMLRKRLSDNALATSLFMVAVSLLFMTSLRGWLTTGHDIQREFRVFHYAKEAGVWNIGSFRDPYNACLSITILPAALSNVLHITDPYVYKVLFQILFASVVPALYILVRRYVNKTTALLAALYFFAFPTFITDMPMLNRQEIAFLFLAVMLMTIFDAAIPRTLRRWLFVMFGLGMVLSHYSTTYSIIAILLFLLAARPVANWLVRRLRMYKLFKHSGMEAFHESVLIKPRRYISITAVLIILAMSFVWSTLITNTSSQVGNVGKLLISNVLNGFKTDSKSSDTSYGLLNFQKTDPQQTLNSYQKKVVKTTRNAAKPGTYYSDATVNKYPLKARELPTAPPTRLGAWLTQHLHVNVGSLNYVFKQASAKLLQVFVVIGILYVLLRRRLGGPWPTDFVLIAGGSLVLVLSQLVLPVLSAEYGLLRAFQQSLMLLGVFLAIGTYAVCLPLKNIWLKHGLPIMFALLFFFSSSSVFSQVLGGYNQQLHLNNSGNYYNIYYLHDSEVASIEWLSGLVALETPEGEVQAPEVQSDRYTLNKVQSVENLGARNDITPGLVRVDSFVYMGYSNVQRGQATVLFNGDTINYTYPTQFLDDNKNLIYDNGTSRIYR